MCYIFLDFLIHRYNHAPCTGLSFALCSAGGSSDVHFCSHSVSAVSILWVWPCGGVDRGGPAVKLLLAIGHLVVGGFFVVWMVRLIDTAVPLFQLP
jgi:hypothetical protein